MSQHLAIRKRGEVVPFQAFLTRRLKHVLEDGVIVYRGVVHVVELEASIAALAASSARGLRLFVRARDTSQLSAYVAFLLGLI